MKAYSLARQFLLPAMVYSAIFAATSAAMFAAASAHAAAPIALRDYTRTTWTARDGAPTEVQQMAQTSDGMLWLSTSTALYRFDGVVFHAFTMPPGAEEMKAIVELRARPNGELWMADEVGGLYMMRAGRVYDRSPPGHAATVQAIAFDPDGSVWAAMTSSLHRFDGRTWRRYDAFEGGPKDQAWSVLADQYGQIWTNNSKGLFLLDRASGTFRHILAATTEGSLITSPDGKLWLAGKNDLVAVPMPPQQVPLPPPEYANRASSRSQAQFDRDGNLWSLQCGPGLCYLPRAAEHAVRGKIDLKGAEHLSQPWQLSSLAVNSVLEDREGNVWLATQNGLDRFRGNKVLAMPIPGERGVFSMASDTEGNVWVAEPAASVAWRLRLDGPAVADRSEPFQLVANDRDGALLLAGRGALVRRYRGKETRLPLPPGRDGKPSRAPLYGILDDGKVLWIASADIGLMGYVDGKWKTRDAFHFPPKVFVSAYGGRPGTLWLGCGDGSVVYYDEGKLTTYDGTAVGMFTAVLPGPEMVVAGIKGLAVMRDGRFHLLHADVPEVLRGVSGLAVAPNGDRWLNGSRGIVQVRAADWRAALTHPERPLRYRLIGAQDGYPGNAMVTNRLHSIFTSPDGQMWFMASGGIVRLDPAAVPRNAVPPEVRVATVTVGNSTYPAEGAVRLPPGSPNFQVSFVAPSLVRADGVRFQYRLAGVDADWQDGGSRRTARYTNVPPGSYRFAVRAINEDAVAGAAQADTLIDVAPALAQTWWFRAAIALLLAGALYALYRYRLHRALARTAEKLHVRMAERERIARTLHDTFLQSVQAVMLRVQAMAMELPAGSAARRKLETILDQVDRTLDEGRDQVHELRSGPDIVQAVRMAGEALQAAHATTRFTLVVANEQRKLQAQTGEEATEICLEAIRNAYHHAGGTQVQVRIAFGETSLCIYVADNGRGMTEPGIRERVEEGHWGMLGMRERAARIGASLAISSKPGAGTTVELTVPRRLAYPDSEVGNLLS
ncbi:sensor histidine kinase [Pseudoduganella albidiflava]|nr:sensor histidine kinase [Pseudoduganella albidiflava]